jgi:hypothetical protein
MDLVDVFFRAVGASYLFAGHLGARTMLLGAVADRMVSTLADEPQDAGLTDRHALLATGVVLTATGGAALTLMSFWALPIFLVNLGLQAGWLLWASTASRRGDVAMERNGLGRPQIALLGAGVALGVLWLWQEGRLLEPDEPVPAGLVLATAVYFSVWLVRDLSWSPNPGEVFDDPDLPAEPRGRPARVRLDPCFGAWPLVDVDRNRRFNHLTWLPEDLAFRIEDWDDMFQLAFDGEQPGPMPDFGTAERAASYVEEGRAIVLALCDHFGADKVELSSTFGDASNSGGDMA